MGVFSVGLKWSEMPRAFGDHCLRANRKFFGAFQYNAKNSAADLFKLRRLVKPPN
jgi:hypothetical protein